jgi:protein-disulfide isomerase
MRHFSLRLGVVTFLAALGIAQVAPLEPKSASGPGTPNAKSALDKTTFETYIRHVNRWGKPIRLTIQEPKPSTALPGFLDVLVRATDGTRSGEVLYHVSQSGERIIRGEVFNVNENPFKANLVRLKTESQPSLGTPGAPVVIVLFSDFQCGYCREEAKMLRQNLLTAYPKEVRLYFKDLPLEQIHPWAKPAAVAGRCIYRQNAASFWDFHDWVFENQSQITLENLKPKLIEFAGSKNIDMLQLNRCLDTRATEAEVNQSLAESRELKVFSTPTMFVNGRKLEGQIGWPELRETIDLEIEYQKTAKNAGEDCGCDLKLPVPGN